MNNEIRIFLFINLVLLALPTTAQDIVVYKSTDKILSIGTNSLYLNDDTKELKYKDVISNEYAAKFKPNKRPVPNFGYINSAFWCKFIIENKSGEELFLEYRQALSQEVEFIYEDDNGVHSIISGTNHPYETRDVKDNYFLFRIPQTTAATTYYLRVETQSNTSFPLFIGNAESMFSKHRQEELVFGIFFGLILALVLHSAFIFYAIRDYTYLYYCLYLLLSTLVYDDASIGLGTEYLWGSLGIGQYLVIINHLLICVIMILNLLFISSFMDIKTNWPKLLKINNIVYATGIILIILELIVPNQLVMYLIEFYLITVLFYCLFIITYLFTKGIRTAQYLIIGWSFYVLGIVIFMLYIFGILSYSEFITKAPMYGLSLECIFFSFGLADRLGHLREAKLQVQKEKNELIKQQNYHLEKAVYERTLEISTQNEEIAAQNEELITMQDQMLSHNNTLEAEVNKKTKDLSNLNDELIDQNQQLQQYSFIAAHNLRSPVATVLGLINLLNINDTENKENKYIVQQIKNSGENLDRVIKDLTTILDIKNGLFEKSQKVRLVEVITRVQQVLQKSIDKHKVQIEIQIEEEAAVFGFNAYLESIFYNLLSNAIK